MILHTLHAVALGLEFREHNRHLCEPNTSLLFDFGAVRIDFEV